jgi:hypothetical protein
LWPGMKRAHEEKRMTNMSCGASVSMLVVLSWIQIWRALTETKLAMPAQSE